jgi:RNA polymerase sigma-70 factor (ECF subfamily)
MSDALLHVHDSYLLARLQEGCRDSFNILYERYWETVYRNAFRILQSRDRAQDITQDIFIQLWLRRDKLEIANIPAYLHTSVRNRVLNFLEKERYYVPIEQLLYDNEHRTGDAADLAVLQHELLNAYHALVDSLPVQRKKIFSMYYDEGLSTGEIARQLNLSRKTVQNQLGRAASMLRTNLSNLFLLAVIIGLLRK